jgi:hypothetical protein
MSFSFPYFQQPGQQQGRRQREAEKAGCGGGPEYFERKRHELFAEQALGALESPVSGQRRPGRIRQDAAQKTQKPLHGVRPVFSGRCRR